MLLADRVLRRALSLRLLETKKDVLLRLLVTDKFLELGSSLLAATLSATCYMTYSTQQKRQRDSLLLPFFPIL